MNSRYQSVEICKFCCLRIILGSSMLILIRRVGEAMRLGEDITVTVLGVRGNQVRIGIDPPKSVSIQLEEIYSTAVTDRTPEIGDGLSDNRDEC